MTEGSSFNVYWNIPSYLCKEHKINLPNLFENYGIIQNNEDKFCGEKYTILYDKGCFPEYKKNSKVRNKGLPTLGDLEKHLSEFKKHIHQIFQSPEDYHGICCIDFESWKPIFRQNFGDHDIYKKKMIETYPDLDEEKISKIWEDSSKKFVEETLKLAHNLLPNAKIGYYAFLYCFNNDGQLECSNETMKENDRMTYIWKNVDIIFPSVYLSEKLDEFQRQGLVCGRIREAKRIAQAHGTNIKILAYVSYNYSYTKNFLSKHDLFTTFQTVKSEGGDGIVLWGASEDLDTKEKCEEFKNYIIEILGPIVQKFTTPD